MRPASVALTHAKNARLGSRRYRKTQRWAAANPAIRKAGGDYLARNVGWRMDA
jgi:hypothetical protein